MTSSPGVGRLPKDGLSTMTIAHSLSDPLRGISRAVVPGVLSGTASETAEAIAQQIHEQTLAMLLPEQEWCENCSHDDDSASESGMPQDIIDRAIEPLTYSPDQDPDWRSGPLYEVTYLACGHTIAHPPR